ncbi:Syndecan-like protein [Dinothrombium tinctorium]|uniref:Syndecan n=1 Tax=Dinothrombium tinctorium TaxID=1965070 RepID=A0A3S3PPA3_9ACAR|nr:Syndecan-like protein [Dinothrombium tinctorium]RWS05549.1 Syndecan-like protein [Dinothrombium tinctorium]
MQFKYRAKDKSKELANELDENKIVDEYSNFIPESTESSTKLSSSPAPKNRESSMTDSNEKDEPNGISILGRKQEAKPLSFFAQPGILAGETYNQMLKQHVLICHLMLIAVIGGAVVGLLCAILLVMFIVYRMRKKDEGSYALDEPKMTPAANPYTKANSREFYA